MAGARVLAASLWLGLPALGVFCAPSSTRAEQPWSVAVGEIGSQAGDTQSARALSQALERELDRAPNLRRAEAPRAQWLLHGSLTRLDRARRGPGLEVRCEISLIVSDARTGSIRAMLNGRAGARGNDASELSRSALEAAVRGALRPLSSLGTPGRTRMRSASKEGRADSSDKAGQPALDWIEHLEEHLLDSQQAARRQGRWEPFQVEPRAGVQKRRPQGSVQHPIGDYGSGVGTALRSFLG